MSNATETALRAIADIYERGDLSPVQMAASMHRLAFDALAEIETTIAERLETTCSAPVEETHPA